MNEISKKYEKLNDSEKKKIILKRGIPFYIIGGILLILGVVSAFIGLNVYGIIIILPAIIIALLGFRKMLLKGEKKDNYIKSVLTSEEIKKSKVTMTAKDIEKYRFDNDPIYNAKVIAQIHKTEDGNYNKKIKSIERDLSNEKSKREYEIKRIAEARWESIGDRAFTYNTTEGIIKVNDTTYPFTAIKGAEINEQDSFRSQVSTTQNTKGKSKKHASIGGGVAGYVVAGPVGALVGGAALGKKTQNSTTNTVTNSNDIPTCYHIGVKINLDGFVTEIVLLTQTVDQSSSTYSNTIKNAQLIVDKLGVLSKTPVPKKFLKPEEEESVLTLDKNIKEYEKQLEIAKKDVPTYELPDIYK